MPLRLWRCCRKRKRKVVLKRKAKFRRKQTLLVKLNNSNENNICSCCCMRLQLSQFSGAVADWIFLALTLYRRTFLYVAAYFISISHSWWVCVYVCVCRILCIYILIYFKLPHNACNNFIYLWIMSLYCLLLVSLSDGFHGAKGRNQLKFAFQS